MSRLCLPNGDDHPEAAHKHLLDAGALLAQNRTDGAAYLSGYVVECALKSLYVLETGSSIREHKFANLVTQVGAIATVAGARSARYFGKATRNVVASAIGAWCPEMLYRAPYMAYAEAQAWYLEAKKVYQETVFQMKMDGVI